MKFQTREIICYDIHIALKLCRHLDSAAPKVPVKFKAIGKVQRRISRLRDLAVRRPSAFLIEALEQDGGGLKWSLFYQHGWFLNLSWYWWDILPVTNHKAQIGSHDRSNSSINNLAFAVSISHVVNLCKGREPSRGNKIEQGRPGSPLAPSNGAFELTHGSASIIGW